MAGTNSSNRDDFKDLWGATEKEAFPGIDSADDIISSLFKGTHSNYPLRSLGIKAEGGELYISEEERDANFHIIGASKQGKSKFLEYNIRKDIDAGTGLCLIDPSDFGATFKAVLEYCASINHQKVLVIDPSNFHKYQKIPTIQLLKQKRIKQSVGGVMEVANILFGSKEVETPRIKRYLPALIRVLTKGGFTLYESRYFADYNYSKLQQNMIVDKLSLGDPDVITLKGAFRSPIAFEQYFSSTINRLDSFWQEPFSLMLSADTGIDFNKMISEGWVILVNLFADGTHLNPTDSQLLGILIINQLIQAVDILKANGWSGVYYLYIDEAGRFATPQIDDLLTNKRKSGLRLMFAHHFFKQFKDKTVLQAVKQNTGIKVMFNLPDPDDRLEMIKSLGYGGAISPSDASYANQDLPIRHAIIKAGKLPPRKVRIHDVPEINVSQSDLEQYTAKLMEQPWYLTKDEINKQIYKRLYGETARQDIKSTQSGKVDDPQTDSSTPIFRPIRRKLEKGIRPDNKKPPEPPPKRPIKI